MRTTPIFIYCHNRHRKAAKLLHFCLIIYWNDSSIIKISGNLFPFDRILYYSSDRCGCVWHRLKSTRNHIQTCGRFHAWAFWSFCFSSSPWCWAVIWFPPFREKKWQKLLEITNVPALINSFKGLTESAENLPECAEQLPLPPPPKSTCRLKQCNMEGERTDSVDPNSTEKRDGKKKRKKGKRGGVRTPPLSGSLLPVVMVIRGFGQDYEIFYLVTSALLERTSKPARSVSVSLTPPDSGGKARTVFVTYAAKTR